MARLRSFALSAAILAAVLGPGTAAVADALVVVRVRGATGEGRVTLTRAGGQSYSCQTVSGTCRINGVPGGAYEASFVKAGATEEAPRRSVMIPPSGTVRLSIAGR